MRAFSMSDEQALRWARGLILGVFATMLISTSLAIGVEFAAYIVFALAPVLRGRLLRVLRHPVMGGFLVFIAVIVANMFHGPASWYDALSALEGWRRALLLPLALAVFDDEDSKRLALKTLLAVCLLGVVASFVTDNAGIWLSEKLQPGIVFRNYTTQGLTFTIAMIGAIAAVMRTDIFAGDRILGNRPAMGAMAALMAFDIVFVLWGRSAYVAVLVMGVVTVVQLARGSWRVKAAAGTAILVAIGLLLAASPQTWNRVAIGLQEIATVDTAPAGSSFGQRIVMWRNTAKMIADHPIIGVGTGSFRDGYRPYIQGDGWRSFETGDPHNQFMKFQGEQGIFGLAAVLFFIFRVITCPGSTPYRELAVAVIISWCVTSLANAHFSTFVEGRLLFLWLGVFLAGPCREPMQTSKSVYDAVASRVGPDRPREPAERLIAHISPSEPCPTSLEG
jgi:O-antigen ligase